jgi:hypothetical protein
LELYADSINSHESFSKGTHLKTPIVLENKEIERNGLISVLNNCQRLRNETIITMTEMANREIRE